jgi:hypothetical protein
MFRSLEEIAAGHQQNAIFYDADTMLPGSVVAEVDPLAFAPDAFMKVDTLKPKK